MLAERAASEGPRSTCAVEVTSIPSRDGGRKMGKGGARLGEERVLAHSGGWVGENVARSRGQSLNSTTE